jgi:amidohydrolase
MDRSPTLREAAEALARALHADPEVSLEEVRASGRCQAFLRSQGFEVQEGVAGLPTAFVATGRPGTARGPLIGFLAEFDALPGVGHGCGHHLIAGAVLEAAARLEAEAPHAGTVKVFGTPAEEVFAGKGVMLRAGVFAGVDATVTYHPHDGDGVFGHLNGVRILDLKYTGRSAHAASRPWNGRSAQDGAVLAATAVALERQYVPEGGRLHAFFQESDGSHNVFPAAATLRVNARAREMEPLEALVRRVEAIARGTAAATATEVSVEVVQGALPYVTNEGLARLAWEVMGLPPGTRRDVAGSTDLGDVSQAIPTVCVTTRGWDPVVWHSRELHEAGGTPGAYLAMHRAADHMVGIGRRLLAGERAWA